MVKRGSSVCEVDDVVDVGSDVAAVVAEGVVEEVVASGDGPAFAVVDAALAGLALASLALPGPAVSLAPPSLSWVWAAGL